MSMNTVPERLAALREAMKQTAWTSTSSRWETRTPASICPTTTLP